MTRKNKTKKVIIQTQKHIDKNITQSEGKYTKNHKEFNNEATNEKLNN